MKVCIIVAAALALAACSTANGAQQWEDLVTKIATDPRCGHTDRIQGNLGGLTGNNLAVFAERTCPPGVVPAPLTSGDTATSGAKTPPAP